MAHQPFPRSAGRPFSMQSFGFLACRFAECSVALAVALCSAAHAQTGTLTANGVVVATTCTLTVSAATVTLPNVSSTSLKVAGDVSGTSFWSVTASGCSGLGTGPVMRTFFEYGPNVSTGGRLKNVSGSATNVEVQIVSPTGAVVDLTQGAGAQNVSSTSLSSGSGTQRFVLRYYATGQAGAGSFSSYFVWTMLYS